MGTIHDICYSTGGPPDLPLAVMVKFDHYSGPTFHDQGTVPIIPIYRTWFKFGYQCSRLQLPLRLAWAVTIHKSQGLTIDKLVVDIGKRELSRIDLRSLLKGEKHRRSTAQSSIPIATSYQHWKQSTTASKTGRRTMLVVYVRHYRSSYFM